MDKKVLAGVGIGAVVALFLGGNAVASHIAKKEVDKAIADVSDVVGIEYKKVNQSLLGGGTTVKDVVITPVGTAEPIKVNQVVLYDFDQKDDVPTYLNFAFEGISLNLATLNESGDNLAELGYDNELSGDFSTEYEYDEAKQVVRLKKIEVGAEDLGTIEMNMELANITMDQDTLASLPFSLLGAEFQNAKITYRDDSFFERIIESGAEAEGISVDDAKKELIASLSGGEGDDALPQEFIDEMTDFINDPDSFSMTFSPAEPVPFVSLSGASTPEDFIELLNVRFES
ncbi:MAG: hypothetical protein ACFB16_21810 [Phormidesmis sp.]